MKQCFYCGRDNADDANACHECGNQEFKSPSSPDTPPETQQDLVTITRCRTLIEADLIVAQLEGAGIRTFIPDQFLMQSIGWNVNTYGYVRVQVLSDDVAAAKEFLSKSGSAPETDQPA